jgi:fumarate hydratase subunit beta
VSLRERRKFMIKKILLPLNADVVEGLNAGDLVSLSGDIYVARDAAHQRLVETMCTGGELPFVLKDTTIFYAGPAPTPPGSIIGPIGPTTSGRMDPFTPILLENGLRGMIGKGKRSQQVLESMKKNKAVYFGATGGIAVLLSSCISSSVVVAYQDLGPEAILRLTINDMPLVVLNDCHGGDLYNIGQKNAEDLIKHANSL